MTFLFVNGLHIILFILWTCRTDVYAYVESSAVNMHTATPYFHTLMLIQCAHIHHADTLMH